MRAPIRPLIFLIAAATFLSARLGNADDAAPDNSIPTLWVCGDSTAANGRDRGSLRGTGDETRDAIMPDGKCETVHSDGWCLR